MHVKNDFVKVPKNFIGIHRSENNFVGLSKLCRMLKLIVRITFYSIVHHA